MEEVKRIASLVRELAISVALVILVPLLVRYGVRLFFAIDFGVTPLIGLGFIILGSLLKDSAISLTFVLAGLYLALAANYSLFSFVQLEYYDELIRLLVYVATLICLSLSVWRWEKLKQKTV